MNAIQLSNQIKTLPTSLKIMISNKLQPSKNKLLSIKQIAFVGEHKAYVHFVKNNDNTFFLYSKKYLKATNNGYDSVWCSKPIGIEMLSKLITKSCFYRNIERTETLSSESVLSEFPQLLIN